VDEHPASRLFCTGNKENWWFIEEFSRKARPHGILEEIIGEIQDEFDQEIELDYQKIDDYNYVFEGKTMLNDVCRVVGVDTTTFDEVKGDSDSLAGLILELAGRLPKAQQTIAHENYQFKIIQADQRRIIQVKMTLPEDNATIR